MEALRERRGSEAGRRTAGRPDEPPLSELEFVGCTAVPMTWPEFRRYEGRLEVWDARVRTAWMVGEPTSPTHENPSHGLTGLVERIGAVRGAPIECFGSMGLLVRDERGKPRRIMQADQTVYLYPSGWACRGRTRWWSASTTTPTWCWRRTIRRTCAGASSGCTRRGGSRRCGWRFRTGPRRAARGGGGRV